MSKPLASRQKFEELRDYILDHFDNDRSFSRPRKIQAALIGHHDNAWGTEWMEVLILFNCFRRAKPTRTHGALAKLKAKRKKAGQSVEFETFMDRVTKMLLPDFITPHGYNRTFSELNSQKIFNSMGEAVAPLAVFGRPLFLYAGSLLGLKRSGKLIGHDDDIDIGIYLGDYPDNEVPELWLSYKKELAAADLLTPSEIERNSISFKLKTSLPIDIDLFPAWTHRGKLSVYPYSASALAANCLLPLQTFYQDPLMLPAKPEVLLEQSYGENWRNSRSVFSS